MQCVSGPFPQTCTDRPVSTRIYIIQILQETPIWYLWLVGLVVWFSLRVREVPGSTPGRAQQIFFQKYLLYQKFICMLFLFAGRTLEVVPLARRSSVGCLMALEHNFEKKALFSSLFFNLRLFLELRETNFHCNYRQ